MKSKKKLLVITDSLGLPRTKPELLKVEETWPKILGCNYIESMEIFQYSVGGLTSNKVLEFIELYLESYDPDIVIIQVGIVDCCPRVLTQLELSMLMRIPAFIRNRIRTILNKYRNLILKYRDARYVKYDCFDNNIAKIVSSVSSELIFVLVSPPNDKFKEHTLGIEKSIKDYNEIISKHARKTVCIDVKYKESVYMNDMHHLNALGNVELANEILRIIDND